MEEVLAGSGASVAHKSLRYEDKFGPQGTWRGYHDVIDHWAQVSPDAQAVEDRNGYWSYQSLQAASYGAMSVMQGRGLKAEAAPCWATEPLAPRPLALHVPRGREFFAICVGAWRLGLPIAAMSCDMADKEAEKVRNQQIMHDLQPLALIGGKGSESLCEVAGHQGATFIPAEEVVKSLFQSNKETHGLHSKEDIMHKVSPESVLVYVYTGGTTKASKCVTVTHSMALWEADNYKIALGGRAEPGDKMLQYSNLYWGAAVFGQISLGLAVGGCVCFGGCSQGCNGATDALQQLVTDVESFKISVLGVVPSQLRGAWPGGPRSAPSCLRMLIAWADKCPVDLARDWRTAGIPVVDLLIASEYWLALYSDCEVHSDSGVEKHVYRALPSLNARFLFRSQDGSSEGEIRDASVGEAGEMYLRGPTTSPGYVGPNGNIGLRFHGAVRQIDGKEYLRTRDVLKLLPGGGLIYVGRADSMMKSGGQWVDSDALQDAVNAVPGVTQAAVVPGPNGIDALVVLHSDVVDGSAGADGANAGNSMPKRKCVRTTAEGPGAAPFQVLAKVRKVLPSGISGGCRVHVCNSLPLNPVTAKIDRRGLMSQLENIREAEEEHRRKHDRLEKQFVQCFACWCRLALGVLLGPQAVASLLRCLDHAALGSSAAAHAMQLAGFCAGCATRLIVLPELWLAATYVEAQLKLPRFEKLLQKWSLPRQWSRWLPLLLAACLPSSWLQVLGAAECSLLSWVREHDLYLTLGFSSITASLAAGLMPDSLTSIFGAQARLSAGLLGTVTAAMSIKFPEFISFMAAAPGLFYQVLPKMLSDDFGWKIASWASKLGSGRLHRLMSSLALPQRTPEITFKPGNAIVDHGNVWDRVFMEAHQGKNVWNSIGVTVKLQGDLVNDPLLAPALNNSPPENAKHVAGNNSSGFSAVVERICGGRRHGDSLHGLDSLQAIQLAETVRREFKKPISVSDILKCGDVQELLDLVQRTHTAEPAQQNNVHADHATYKRIWLCGLGAGTCSVDWMVCRQTEEQHLNVDALQRAVDHLVARHSALRAQNSREAPMFDATYLGASLWQLWCSSGQEWTRSKIGHVASSSLYESWPRTTVLPACSPDAKINLLRPRLKNMTWDDKWGPAGDNEQAFWIGNTVLRENPPGSHLFQICIIPVFKVTDTMAPECDAVDVALSLPPKDVTWYIYAVLDHGYCDGPAGLPLFADLLRLYAEETGECQSGQTTEAGDALTVLENRLLQSLKPLPDAEHSNDDIFHDDLGDWGRRRGYTRFIRFDTHLMQILRFAASTHLGCSVDVAWLTVIAAAFLRMFPLMRRLDLYLVVTCRDRPNEELMIGYFSSRKLLPIEFGDARNLALLGLCDIISTARRLRTWRRPRPFERSEAIEVNIVSQVAEGLPHRFKEVRCPRSAPRDWSRGTAGFMNLRLDQVALDDWDFRLQSHDASWGPNWSTYYTQALGSVIVDMAMCPTGPVVPEA